MCAYVLTFHSLYVVQRLSLSEIVHSIEHFTMKSPPKLIKRQKLPPAENKLDEFIDAFERSPRMLQIQKNVQAYMPIDPTFVPTSNKFSQCVTLVSFHLADGASFHNTHGQATQRAGLVHSNPGNNATAIVRDTLRITTEHVLAWFQTHHRRTFGVFAQADGAREA